MQIYNTINSYTNLYNSFVDSVNNFIKAIENNSNKIFINPVDITFSKIYNDIETYVNIVERLFKAYMENSVNSDLSNTDRYIIRIVKYIFDSLMQVRNLYVNAQEILSMTNVSKNNNSGVKAFGYTYFASGDNIDIISERLGVSADDIISINNLDFPYVSGGPIQGKNTLYPGKKYKYPIVNSYGIISAPENYIKGGIDIRFTDDSKIDYNFSDNKIYIYLVSGKDNLLQSIKRRLNTFVGEWSDNFGIPNILDLAENSPNLSKILIANAILRDNRIAKVNSIELKIENRAVQINVDVTSNLIT